MAEDLLRYDLLIEEGLRSVVRKAFETVARDGFPGDHHFYITFKTTYPGVELAAPLRQKYSDDMTIVLQHQFFGLKITDVGFGVVLSFNRAHERLFIPFDAITAFSDPSVNFALQFQVPASPSGSEGASGGGVVADLAPLRSVGGGTPQAPATPSESAKTPVPSEPSSKTGEVISLDRFRKK